MRRRDPESAARPSDSSGLQPPRVEDLVLEALPLGVEHPEELPQRLLGPVIALSGKITALDVGQSPLHSAELPQRLLYTPAEAAEGLPRLSLCGHGSPYRLEAAPAPPPPPRPPRPPRGSGAPPGCHSGFGPFAIARTMSIVDSITVDMCWKST